jgi:hypothetical protein
MPIRSVGPSWLPDHQLHVAMTLGHADSSLQRLGEVLHDYLANDPMEFANVPDGELCHVTLAGIAPLPCAVPRLAADVLTQLRTAIEHTLYAEVQELLGRELTGAEERRVEMPAVTTPEDFDNWLKARKRPDLAPLRHGSELVNRMRALQPYHRRDADNHPLRVLAEHTNLAKHRTPTVAAVRLGKVHTWPLDDPDVLVGSSGVLLEVGTILATGPLYKQVPIDIWPTVAIRRPHTRDWKVVMNELGVLEEWVRTVAVPVLVTGSTEVNPLPPQIDITRGWANVRDAIRSGGSVPAAKRTLIRMQARVGRVNLAETLALHPERIDREIVDQWLASQSDEEVVAKLDVLAVAANKGPHPAADACAKLIQLADDWSRQESGTDLGDGD